MKINLWIANSVFCSLLWVFGSSTFAQCMAKRLYTIDGAYKGCRLVLDDKASQLSPTLVSERDCTFYCRNLTLESSQFKALVNEALQTKEEAARSISTSLTNNHFICEPLSPAVGPPLDSIGRKEESFHYFRTLKKTIELKTIQSHQVALRNCMDHWRQEEQNAEEKCEEDLKFLIEKVQGSALTINFDCMKLFYEPNQADGFLSPYEVPLKDTDKANTHFREGRHKYEVKMFGIGSNYQHSDEFVNKTGSSQHPIYGSVNITHSKQGGAPIYGKCHAKLKDKVKSISTFLRGDSLVDFDGDHAEQDDFATYDNLYPLFRNMDAVAMARIKNGDKSLLDHYMEYQVHGPVKWVDVEEITLESDDLLPQRFKRRVPLDAKIKIRTHAEELKTRAHVPIHFVGDW